MKKILLLLLLFTLSASAQNVRYDASVPSISSVTAIPFLIANTGTGGTTLATLAVCHSPATGQTPATGCTNYVTTYTYNSVACPNSAQDTPNGQTQPTTCQSTGDTRGDIGFWAPPGTYDYTIVVSGAMYGPYTVTLGGSGGPGVAGPYQVLGNNSGAPTSASFFNLGVSNLPFTYSGSTTKLATTTGSLVPGDCVTIDASQNFIDNGSGCGGGGGGGIVPNPSVGVSQYITQLPSTGTVASNFGSNIFNNTYYVPPPALAVTVGGANWQQSPSGSISVGTNTVTLSPCPPGLMTVTQAPRNANWTRVWIAGTGTPEAVILTNTTCPNQGRSSSGTITFTAANSHSNGFTVGSASGGLQETINSSARCVVNTNCVTGGPAFGKVIVPPGDYTILGRVSINVLYGGSVFDFSSTTLTCNLSDTCLYIGDTTDTFLHSIDTVIQNITCTPAIVNGNYPCIEDASQGVKLDGVYGSPGSDGGGATGKTSFGRLIQIDNDEAYIITHLDTSGSLFGPWSHCGTDFCSEAVYITNGSGGPAPTGEIDKSNFQMSCIGNGIDNQGGNGLHISDSQIQAYNQFGVRSTSTFSTNLTLQLDNTYAEIGSCNNPLGTGAAGVIANNGPVLLNGNEGGYAGRMTPLLNTGSTTQFNWYVVVKSGSNVSPPYPVAYATTAANTGAPVVKWPQAGTTGTITYDLIRDSLPVGNTAFAPYTAICGGGSATACGSVATAVATSSCSNKVCSFTDDLSANTTSYTFAQPPTYFPSLMGTHGAGGVPPWPGTIVLSGAENASTSGGTFAYANATALTQPSIFTISGGGGPVGIVQAAGASFPTVSVPICAVGGLWSPVWIDCKNSDADQYTSQLFQMGSVINGHLTAGTQGKVIFTGAPGASYVNGHIITLLNSHPEITLTDPTQTLYRATPWNANDTFLALDNAAGAFAATAAQLGYGSPVSHSWYIGSNPDNSNWKMRLTATGLASKVPLTFSGTTFAFNSPEVTAPANPAASTESCWAAAGSGLECIDHAGNVYTMQSSGSGSFYQTVQNSGSSLTQQPTLNFTGSGVSCVNNGGASRTDCTITGGGGATAFSSLTSGSNTAAAMTVGTGASLTFSGSGTINAGLLNGTAFSGTSGHLVSFGAANIPADSGIVGANLTTASGTLTSNLVLLGAGTKTMTTAGADSTTTHAFFATAGAPAFRAIAAGDIPALNQNTTGTAANLSGTPALPNGTTGTTQAVGDATAKLATDAFVLANAVTTGGMTLNRLQKATAATALSDSCFSDDGTTVTNNCSGGIIAGSGNPSIQTNTASNTDLAGTGTMTGGTFTYSFLGTWASAPICVATDTAAANAVRVQTSTSTLTVTGTSGDGVNYICVERT